MKIRLVGSIALLILAPIFNSCAARVVTANKEISSELLIQSEPSNTQLPPPPQTPKSDRRSQ